MWLVSCRKQGMLTQGPTPNPMCKLNVSSFLTLPHLLDCFSCTRNSVFIVLFLGLMWGWDRWRGGGVVDSYQGVGGRTRGGYYLIVFLCFLCCRLSCLVSFLSE